MKNTNENKNIYQNNWQYLKDELTKLDLLLKYQILKYRRFLPQNHQDVLKGFTVTDREIDNLFMDKNQISQDQDIEEDARTSTLEKTIDKFQSEILLKKKLSLENGKYLALSQLSQLFNLSDFEEQIVIICLAPELEKKYEKVYAYLQEDVNCKNASVDLIMKLLCSNEQEMLAARTYFLPNSKLFKSQVLMIANDQHNSQQTFMSRSLKLDDRIVNFLLGFDDIDYRIESFSDIVFPRLHDNNLNFSQEIKDRLVTLTKNHLEASNKQRGKLIYYFCGFSDSNKQTMAEGICYELGVPLVVSDIKDLISRELPFEEMIKVVYREALLQPAAIYLKDFDCLLANEDQYYLYFKILVNIIDHFSWLTFLDGKINWDPVGLFHQNTLLKIEFSLPDYTIRSDIWKSVINGKYYFSDEIDIGKLAIKFRFTPDQVENALIEAQNLALLNQPDDPKISSQQLYQACRAQCKNKLIALAHKIKPNYTWKDIILPKNILQQLHAICDQVNYKNKVYRDWGFDQKFSLGKGVSALFSGPSGTGKTMAAEILANDLQIDLYKIDLSRVVSKYIGETEKNLDKVFQEAENSSTILFFDEADALFGKRSEVRDAHDRYANIEIGYLLQKMEEYEGICILATNLKKNIDDAFLRRLHFVVEFPLPDDRHRYQMWQQMFPEQTPLSKDIDCDFLSKRFKITGGNIKNIVVNSAFLAASNSGIVRMEHLIRATKMELDKIGRLSTEVDFGKYWKKVTMGA